MKKNTRNMLIGFAVFAALLILVLISHNNNQTLSIGGNSIGSPSYSLGQSGSSGGATINNTKPASTFSISQSCSPSSPYNKCVQYQNSYSFATATAQIQTTDPPQGTVKGGYYVGDIKLPAKFQGTKFYLYKNAASWDSIWANCGQNGCTGGTQLNNPDSITLATAGQQSSYCPALVSFAYDYETRSDGSWAWTWVTAGYGWTGSSCSWKSVACYDNTDCSTNQFCDKSGSWNTWSCKAKECDAGQTKCDPTTNAYSTCSNYKWASQGVVKGQCNVQCLQTSDCANLNNVSANFCSSNSVVKTISTGSCNTGTYQCSTNQQQQVVQQCKLGCSTNQCFEDTATFGILWKVAIGVVILVIVLVVVLLRRRRRK